MCPSDSSWTGTVRETVADDRRCDSHLWPGVPASLWAHHDRAAGSGAAGADGLPHRGVGRA